MRAIANPIPPVAVKAPRCQESCSRAPSSRDAGGLLRLPLPVSTPGFDSAPYLTATLCITRDPETGIQNMGTYRAAFERQPTAWSCAWWRGRRAGRGVILTLAQNRKRGEHMPIAIVIGCAPVVMFTGPQRSSPSIWMSSAWQARSPALRSRLRKRAQSTSKCRPGPRSLIGGLDRSGPARAGGAVRREQWLCRARSYNMPCG